MCLHVESDDVTVYLSAWNGSALAGLIFVKFDVAGFFTKSCQANSYLFKTGQNAHTLHKLPQTVILFCHDWSLGCCSVWDMS